MSGHPLDGEVLLPVTRRRALIAGLGLTLGASIWAASAAFNGVREPFDGPLLYYGSATFAAGAIATLPSPRDWWLAILSVYLGEQLYAFAAYPETRAWFLFGLVVNALIPTWFFTALGALSARFAARRLTGRIWTPPTS